jgi:hypothetical protein
MCAIAFRPNGEAEQYDRGGCSGTWGCTGRRGHGWSSSREIFMIEHGAADE